jgi:hypothetical protein
MKIPILILAMFSINLSVLGQLLTSSNNTKQDNAEILNDDYKKTENLNKNTQLLNTQKSLSDSSQNIFKLSKSRTITSISKTKYLIEIFEIINGNKKSIPCILLKMGNQKRVALGIRTDKYNEITNTAILIDLNDGQKIFEFPYKKILNTEFSKNDSILYYQDNTEIKQINLETFEIKGLFQIETIDSKFNNMIVDENKIHICQSQYSTPKNKIIHYTYDIISNQTNKNTFDDFDNSVKSDLESQFKALPGNTKDKTIMLKLLNGNSIQIKPLENKSNDEFIIVKFPNIIIAKNESFVVNKEIKIFKTDKKTNEVLKYNIDINRGYDKDYINLMITESNQIVFNEERILYVIDLNETIKEGATYNIKTDHVDPYEIPIGIDVRFKFICLDSKKNKISYQTNGCSNSSFYQEIIQNKSNYLESKFSSELSKDLNHVDSKLISIFESKFNKSTLSNEILESDSEKYYRLQNLIPEFYKEFIKTQDSLFNNVKKKITDSIKTFTYNPLDVFKIKNYDISNEAWNLTFSNPYSGKNFKAIFNQPKQNARLWIQNNFTDIIVNVTYYLNLISLKYEPLLLSIENTATSQKISIPISFLDFSLLKNLFLTNNSYLSSDIKENSISCWNNKNEVIIDTTLFNHLISIGKPKFYFDYGFDFYNFSPNKISIKNLDDKNFISPFQNYYNKCCPQTYAVKSLSGDMSGEIGYDEYVRFDVLPYFIKKSTDSNKPDSSQIYEINKLPKITTIEGRYDINNTNLVNKNQFKFEYIYEMYKGVTSAKLNIIDLNTKNIITSFDIFKLSKSNNVNWDGAFSPNGKYFAMRCNNVLHVYETDSWENMFSFTDASGKIYWDCNSYFLGSGLNIIPIELLNQLVKK